MEHAGGNFGYSADTLRFPEQRFAVFTLCNLETANPVRLSFQVADIYLEENLAATAPGQESGLWTLCCCEASGAAGRSAFP